jgi:hypothetical protein
VPGNSSGQLVEAVSPGRESGTENCEGLLGPSQGVAPAVTGLAGEVVDGVDEPTGTQAGIPPGAELANGPP